MQLKKNNNIFPETPETTQSVAADTVEPFRVVDFPADDSKNRVRYEGALKNGIPNGQVPTFGDSWKWILCKSKILSRIVWGRFVTCLFR
jgi:hypothetical protein